MGLTQILSTALDGLNAQSVGLSTTGDNISNVNTPGYARREVQLETRGQGLTGVNVAGLQRVSDTVVERRQYQAMGLSSAASERDSELANVEGLFDDSAGSGLADALSAFYSSFSSLASNPSDPTARAAVLNAAGALSGRINDTANSIASARADLFSKAKDTAAEINQKAQKIAQLNQQIATAKAQGQDSANLQDQRSKVLLDLAPLVDVTTIAQDNGTILVQSSGTTLVDGIQARTLSVGLDTSGNMKISAAIGNGAGTDVTRYLTGGKLAGIKEARDTDLSAVATNLDNFAYAVATSVNTQHAAGYGLDGVTGRNLFSVTPSATGAARALAVSADVAGNPSAIAASSSKTALPGNSDNAVLLSGLSSLPTINGRSASEAYGDLVGDVGARKQAAADDASIRDAVAAQATSARESTSGVSLDEEMVALSKYQRAYEASSKVITTIDQLLGELLNSVGR
ncbi:MAG TPA: flagellar hook-associated protein FlgK [Polyangiaceae bacterium]|nr:flagellar hook-associated protein FlgK [Polyangiaceae bacterium]